MPYSAVIQPFPFPLRKTGVFSSTVAEQMTLVSPTSIMAEPSALRSACGVIKMGRISFV